MSPDTANPIRHSKQVGEVGRMSKRDAERHRELKQGEFDQGTATPAEPRVDTSITIDRLLEIYPERRRQGDGGKGLRRSVKPLTSATITAHLMTLRYLKQHFFGGRTLESISDNDIEKWLEALVAGRLSGARKKSRREYGLSEQKVRGHVRNAKATWNWMIKAGLAAENPLSDFEGAPLATPPNHYVPMEDFKAIITQAEIEHGWRAMFALCRLAGLRREAARTLPWDGVGNDSEGRQHQIGIDWESRRIHVVGNHKTKRVYREVPISPRLYRILVEAYDALRPGVVTVTGLTPHNLVRNAQSLIRSVGIDPWPKLFQAMRSSCENDFKIAGVAEATYTNWMGHSTAVSRAHYVSPIDSEFAAITGEVGT